MQTDTSISRRNDQLGQFLCARGFSASQRRAAARLLRVQAAGENLAMRGARRQARLSASSDERRFLRRQARQEQFHQWLFTGLAVSIDGLKHAESRLPQPLVRIEKQLKGVLDSGDFTAAVVIQHVALEGLGEAVLHRLGSELGAEGRAFRRVHNLVVSQEAEHVEFGRSFLRIAERSPRLRSVRDESMLHAEELMTELAADFAELGGNAANVIRDWRDSLVSRRP